MHTARRCSGNANSNPSPTDGDRPAYRLGWVSFTKHELPQHAGADDAFAEFVGHDDAPIDHCLKLDLWDSSVNGWLHLAALQERGLVSALESTPEYAARVGLEIAGEMGRYQRIRMNAQKGKTTS